MATNYTPLKQPVYFSSLASKGPAMVTPSGAKASVMPSSIKPYVAPKAIASSASGGVIYQKQPVNQPQGQPSNQPSFQAPSQPEQPSFVSPEGQQYGSPEEYYALIDQAYNPQYDYLNQAQSNLEMGQKSALEEAQTAFNTQQQMATGQKESALASLGQTAVKGQQSYESALAQARDLYDQLQRGYNQRFGGSTSAGQAATEIANRERMKQQGLNYRELQNINRQVEMGKADVENQFKQNLLQLEQNKVSAINQVNNDFRDKLAQITQSKGMLESAKAQAKLQALQNLRAQVLQIQAENRQFQQTLELQRQQNAMQLDNYAKQLAMTKQNVGTGAGASIQNLNKPATTNLQAVSTGVANTYSPTGQMTSQYRDPRELMFQNIWGR